MDDFAAFAALVSGLNPNIMPAEDAADIAKGAKTIPEKVTDARRAGQQVVFVQEGPADGWYWLMPDGSQVK